TRRIAAAPRSTAAAGMATAVAACATARVGAGLKARLHGLAASPRLLAPLQTAARAFSEAAGVGRGGARVSMALRSGIVGLPNVGKSTLFNALVENGKAVAANFPFCTIEPNVGVVAVPDPRLGVLSELTSSKRTLPATVEFVDIAGLVKGASQGEGLGNKFLSHIREVDSVVQPVLICHGLFASLTVCAWVHGGPQVVRCFEDTDIVHVSGAVNPTADIDVINLELALADLSQIEKRMERLSKSRSKDPQARSREEAEAGALERIREAVLAGGAARSVALSEEEAALVAQLCLLTAKPIIYAANVAETDLADPSSNPHVTAVRQLASSEGAECVVVSAQVEAELCELGEADRAEYLAALGVEQGGLAGLVQATYRLLGLRTYFTAGEKETRAWTIRAGMTAPQAAGVIHTDFERGFIRAETVPPLPSLSPSLPPSLSPSLPLSLSPSLPLCLSPSLPLPRSPSLPPPPLPLSLSPSLPLSLSPSLPHSLAALLPRPSPPCFSLYLALSPQATTTSDS
ncbi:unnamed protein product, partial [Closterium sp. Naga37s-1]